mmetsp:Transcript_4333/g.6070  ORF Transcript_4333/g.6070 Transcript_4333/m.6070 type:complete len:225 (-) Transcript_4333:475-1149(-)
MTVTRTSAISNISFTEFHTSSAFPFPPAGFTNMVRRYIGGSLSRVTPLRAHRIPFIHFCVISLSGHKNGKILRSLFVDLGFDKGKVYKIKQFCWDLCCSTPTTSFNRTSVGGFFDVADVSFHKIELFRKIHCTGFCLMIKSETNKSVSDCFSCVSIAILEFTPLVVSKLQWCSWRVTRNANWCRLRGSYVASDGGVFCDNTGIITLSAGYSLGSFFQCDSGKIT